MVPLDLDAAGQLRIRFNTDGGVIVAPEDITNWARIQLALEYICSHRAWS
jgi:hypothetical protein